MRAQARIEVTAPTRYRTLSAAPPLALRPTAEALYVAAAAGGPLGGDEVCLDLDVSAGAFLRVRTVSATVALPGHGGTSRWTWRLRVEAGAALELIPEPSVVADAARHRSEVLVDLAPDASLLLREEVVLGRSGECGGRWESRLEVRRGGRLLLAQEYDVDGRSPVDRGPYGLGGARAFGTLVAVGAGVGGEAMGDGWARMTPAATDAVVGVAVGTDARELRRRLEAAAQDPRRRLEAAAQDPRRRLEAAAQVPR